MNICKNQKTLSPKKNVTAEPLNSNQSDESWLDELENELAEIDNPSVDQQEIKNELIRTLNKAIVLLKELKTASPAP